MVFFPDDYLSARQGFQTAGHAVDASLYSLALPVSGPQGEELTIDVAWLGASTAKKLLIHCSGLHGIEGFAGSAVQRQILHQFLSIPGGCALILVHGLNPFGMAWMRRTNAANVDLNRNFIFSGPQRGMSAAAYARLDPLLNPAGPPGPDLFYPRLLFWLLRFGWRKLKTAVVEGQYRFPRGLFFGGSELQQEVLLWRHWLQVKVQSPEQLLVVDLHTGLGEPGQETLFQSLAATGTAELSENLSVPVVNDSRTSKVLGYQALGAHENLFRDLFPACPVDFITQEFGTRSNLRVLQALRRENQWHHFGSGGVDHWSKWALKEVFCPSDNVWRQKIIERGVRLVEKGLAFLAEGK